MDVLGAVKQDTSSSSWANIQLPELCKPAIPLRNLDSSDNRPLGIAIDFSNDITVPPASPDDPQLAAGPVLLVLLDEGCLIAYHCLNVRPVRKKNGGLEFFNSQKKLYTPFFFSRMKNVR